MSEKERNAVENVVRGRQPVLVPLPVSQFFFAFFAFDSGYRAGYRYNLS